MSSVDDIVDSSGVLLASRARKRGISKYALYRFIDTEGYERVAHGVYVSPDAWGDDVYILSLRCPQGVISHDEALYLHGLLDREPMEKTITVYSGYGTGRLTHDGVCVFTVKKNLLEVGKEYHVTSQGHTIPLYNLERTVCDLIRSKRHFEIQDFQTALRTYLGNPKKNMNRLIEYARLFRIESTVRSYMEVMLP
ncbi:abortive phage infection protein [Alloscardovia macacae]|uniref:Abortive phage infection protein n=1 Tax=Alloscardovia macacae TaxID=1160091 RepID=A0A1Y2SXA6_9BIFI|nr:abortive phage infection protein [Alloscardovia macacae]OTA27204.1 abortive phage infection protein [Alloscardovia macacae]OTA28463.1 abortive phage infection protein [Alloscardovia macacae]